MELLIQFINNIKMNKEIFNIIYKDLQGYGQSNPAPKSLTIGSGKDFRHYELDECFGLVAFNEGHVLIVEIKEDDENWFCFNGTDKSTYDAHWLKTKIELYNRMDRWLQDNFTSNYYSGFEGKKGSECGYKNFKR